MPVRLTPEERRLYHKRSWEGMRYQAKQFGKGLVVFLAVSWVLRCIHLGW